MPRYIRLLIACALLLLPPHLAAQQNATVQGIVVDESQAVLPGSTVTATEINTGVQSLAVAEADGRYRFTNLPPGQYKFRIELSGFATTEVANVELLVGQSVTVPRVALKVAALQETITVTSQAPLVNTTSSQVAGNIDRRQMAELPLQGRNWQELSLMVKGVTANNITNTPGANDGQFQLNLDGQQITQRVAGSGFGQPKVSREAIAEFQIVTNMFDIAQGRSTGMQVQAISRSGTNDLKGSTYGFFRNDSFNAADPVTGKVLPFQNQQVGSHSGRPDYSQQDALLRCLRVRAATGHGGPGAHAAPRPDLADAVESDQQELSRPGRLSNVIDGQPVGARAALVGVEPVTDRERHTAPVNGGSLHVECEQRDRHVEPSGRQQHDHAGHRRHEQVRVVLRFAGVE